MKKWTHDKAIMHIQKVNNKKTPYGLTFLSACDYLKISPWQTKQMSAAR